MNDRAFATIGQYLPMLFPKILFPNPAFIAAHAVKASYPVTEHPSPSARQIKIACRRSPRFGVFAFAEYARSGVERFRRATNAKANGLIFASVHFANGFAENTDRLANAALFHLAQVASEDNLGSRESFFKPLYNRVVHVVTVNKIRRRHRHRLGTVAALVALFYALGAARQ